MLCVRLLRGVLGSRMAQMAFKRAKNAKLENELITSRW